MTQQRTRRVVGSVLMLAALCTSFIGMPVMAGGPSAEGILRATGVKGGMVVHIGCGDASLTVAVGTRPGYVVHGLDASPENVSEARERIQSLGIYGPVSVDLFDGKALPYIDNSVSLVVSENLRDVPMAEVMRVLSPRGVAYLKMDGGWVKTIKPVPAEIDDWTHYLHGPDGNPVSKDKALVPPLGRLQWVGYPFRSRHHEYMSSVSALVSSGGRLFYIIDEGPAHSAQLPSQWQLVARDAFNGVVLWKRAIEDWAPQHFRLKSGPADLPRRVVAVGDRVYVTLGIEAPVSVLDAATGKTLAQYEGTEKTTEIIVSDGVLFARTDPGAGKIKAYKSTNTFVWNSVGGVNLNWTKADGNKIVAVDTATSNELWQKKIPVATMTLAAAGGKLFLYDGEKLVFLSQKDGTQLQATEPIATKTIGISTGVRLLVSGETVLYGAGNTIHAFSTQTGQRLWKKPMQRSGHHSLKDLMVAGGLVWSGVFTRKVPGYDPKTGEVVRTLNRDITLYTFHQRCYPSKATENYILAGNPGTEFIDVQKGTWSPNPWARGACVYGIMPANGMMYCPPNPCSCYLEATIQGLAAVAPVSKEQHARLKDIDEDARLLTGPAYGKEISAAAAQASDWPVYRHDAARSGYTKDEVAAENLKIVWDTKLKGKLTAPVVAEGKMFLAAVDAHTVYALDTENGRPAWTYTASGRIDSPPAVYKGRVFFGSRDGHVYSLRASDGELIWRYRAAPLDQRHHAYGQLESVWPLHGSVLIENEALYCVAGRSIFVDGGMRFLKLDPITGKKLLETTHDAMDPDTGKTLLTKSRVEKLTMPVALNDILSSDGQFVYMRSQQFSMDGKRLNIGPLSVKKQHGEGVHLFSGGGFLDDTWWHRTYWQYGRSLSSGYSEVFRAARNVPTGRIMVFDDSDVYAYGRRPAYIAASHVLEYHLYKADKAASPEAIAALEASEKKWLEGTPKRNNRMLKGGAYNDRAKRFGKPVNELNAVQYKWRSADYPIQVRAMVLAGKNLFIAGWPDVLDEEASFNKPGRDDPEMQKKRQEQLDAIDGKKGAILHAVSTADGKKLGEIELKSPPVWDGMAVANGRVFIVLKNGSVICLDEE